MKMAKNVSQQTIVEKLGISKNDISEILLKLQGTRSVLDQPRCGHSWKLQHRIVWKLNWTKKENCKTSDGWVQLVQFSGSRYH